MWRVLTDHSVALIPSIFREQYGTAGDKDSQFTNRDEFLSRYLWFAEFLVEDPGSPKTPCSDSILRRRGLKGK